MLTAKQEAFCLAVANGATHTDAYRTVYGPADLTDKKASSKAAGMMKRTPVVQRIACLREGVAKAVAEKTAEKIVYTLDDALREADEARELAHDEGSAAGAVQAVKLKAQLAGLIVEKRETTTTSQLSDSDVKAIAEMKAAADAALKAAQEMVDMVDTTAEAEAQAHSLRKAA
jgi:hypothetical protein